MCLAISQGPNNFPSQLAKRSIGPLCHSRWTTAANRILRVYVSNPQPSQHLKAITKFIMNVYAPMMFQIKYKSSIVFGPSHLANIIELSRCLPEKYLKVVQESIKRNAFFAHPEHIILAMLNDERFDVRKTAWQRILDARHFDCVGIRKFRIPNALNFSCTSYMDMIDLDSFTDTDPPIIRDIPISAGNIDTLALNKLLEHDFGKFLIDMPLHTQSVERSVKLVTAASKRTAGEQSRNGLIFNTLASRNAMPKFASKKDFVLDQNVHMNHFAV